jgi:hypothetical protein
MTFPVRTLLEQKDFLLQMSPVTTRELQEHRFPSLPYFLMRAHEETDPELLMSNSPTAVYVGFLRGSNGSTFSAEYFAKREESTAMVIIGSNWIHDQCFLGGNYQFNGDRPPTVGNPRESPTGQLYTFPRGMTLAQLHTIFNRVL